VLLKNLPAQIEKDGPRFVMSASAPDRVKDTIDPAAYKPWEGKRLVALWQHNHDQPFGTWENLSTKAGKLIGDLKIAGTNLGEMIKALLDADVPLGASIGFRGRGEPNKVGGLHFKEIELLECSVVSVPAHPAAYQIAKHFQFDLSVQAQFESVAKSGDASLARQRAAQAIIAAKRQLRTKQ
jgi:HK97 family phage prohead protease